MKPEEGRWKAFTKTLLDRDARRHEALDAFFDINPFMRDMGNRNWHNHSPAYFRCGSTKGIPGSGSIPRLPFPCIRDMNGATAQPRS